MIVFSAEARGDAFAARRTARTAWQFRAASVVIAGNQPTSRSVLQGKQI